MTHWPTDSMRTYAYLVIAALSLVSGASAYGVPNGTISLDASGYTAVPQGLDSVSLDLAGSATVTDTSTRLLISGGTLSYGDETFDTLSITGSFLRDEHFVRLTGIAEGSGNAVTMNLLGRLAETSNEESLYLVTGTFTRQDHTGKAVLALSISELAAAPVRQQIGDAIPSTTIVDELRFATDLVGYFEPSSVQLKPGESLRLINNDTKSHRLVSGAVIDWTYDSDGDPRVCAPDGTPDDQVVSPKKDNVGTYLDNGVEVPFVVPEEPSSSHRRSSNPDAPYGCDFVRDDRIDVTIGPGAQATVRIDDVGIYRLLDTANPWIYLQVISIIPDTPLGR